MSLQLDELDSVYKIQAVITTYEMIVLDTPHLMDVDWKCLIIDEAHRLKNQECKLVECLRNLHLVSSSSPPYMFKEQHSTGHLNVYPK